MQHIYIRLARDVRGYPPADAEELDASQVGPDTWQIEASPTFLYGAARGDVVRVAEADDGSLWATEIVSNAGNWCARVVPFGGAPMEPIVEQFRSVGCSARPTRYGLVVVDPPASMPVSQVKVLLEAGRADRRWDFDLGVVPEGY